MLLQIMLILSFLSFLISTRLMWVFNNLRKKVKSKEVLPLANVMFVKSVIFTVISGLITSELFTFIVFPKQTQIIQLIHWPFNCALVVLLFIAQAYLYWLVESRNGWH